MFWRNSIISKALRAHNASSLLISLLVTAIVIALAVLFFLRTRGPDISRSSEPSAYVPETNTRIPLGSTKKAIDDAGRRILEDSKAIEDLQ